MRPRIAEHSHRGIALALVALLHALLIWGLLSLSRHDQNVQIMTTLVQLVEPEKVKIPEGAPVKAPQVNLSQFQLPVITPPKLVVTVTPSPTAPPAPAPAAAASGESAPTIGEKPKPVVPPDDFTAYAALIHKRMQAALNDISASRVSQRQGDVVVDMQVDRNGKILVWAMENDHPPAWMRYEIKELMEMSNPLPPFPDNIRADSSVFSVPVTFNESGQPGF